MSFKNKPLKKCHTDKRQMIDDIHTGIIKGLTGDDITEYYLTNGELLSDYYSNKKEVKSDSTEGILSFFQSDEVKDDMEDERVNKTKLFNQYLCNIDDTTLNIKYSDYAITKCKACDEFLTLNPVSGVLGCPLCGSAEDVLIFSEKGSYNDPPKEANYFAYKRINHFNEWLAQFQAKETTELPPSIYKDVHGEFKKYKFNKDTDISYKQMREILKTLNYNKYYEHIPHLINALSGKKAPTLSRKAEETLRSLFKDIQVPFMNNCPPNRKNFLSYSYVLHKFCELLEYDELLIYFPLLKSREKLQQQDQIWGKICSELKWQYIPST